MQTLKHSMQILEFVKTKGIEVKFHGRTKNEASHYCGQCEVSRNGTIKVLFLLNIFLHAGRSFQHFVHSRARKEARGALHGLCQKAVVVAPRVRLS